jgi:hypothetical protein
MDKSNRKLSIIERLEQITDMKKNENSALKKIANFLQQKEKPKNKFNK